MQLSNETNSQDLYSIAREILGIDPDNTTDLTLAAFVRACNIGRYKMLSVVLRADGRFKFDGTDQTDQPIGKFDLVSGQYEYGFASTHLKILGISVINSNGDFEPLINKGHITDLPQDFKTYRNVNGTPREFAFGGNSFYLFPQANQTTTGKTGGKVYFQRNITPYPYNATTQETGFAPQFDHIVAYHGCIPYAIRNVPEKLPILLNLIKEGHAEMQEFYATRDVSQKPALRFRKTDYGARGNGSIIPPVINA
jgi:hypothetical protein